MAWGQSRRSKKNQTLHMRCPWKQVDRLKPLRLPVICPSTEISRQSRRVARQIENPLQRQRPIKKSASIRTQSAPGRIDQTKRAPLPQLRQAVIELIFKSALQKLRSRSFPSKNSYSRCTRFHRHHPNATSRQRPTEKSRARISFQNRLHTLRHRTDHLVLQQLPQCLMGEYKVIPAHINGTTPSSGRLSGICTA